MQVHRMSRIMYAPHAILKSSLRRWAARPQVSNENLKEHGNETRRTFLSRGVFRPNEPSAAVRHKKRNISSCCRHISTIGSSDIHERPQVLPTETNRYTTIERVPHDACHSTIKVMTDRGATVNAAACSSPAPPRHHRQREDYWCSMGLRCRV